MRGCRLGFALVLSSLVFFPLLVLMAYALSISVSVLVLP